jgi:hypothetical protein
MRLMLSWLGQKWVLLLFVVCLHLWGASPAYAHTQAAVDQTATLDFSKASPKMDADKHVSYANSMSVTVHLKMCCHSSTINHCSNTCCTGMSIKSVPPLVVVLSYPSTLHRLEYRYSTRYDAPAIPPPKSFQSNIDRF